LRTPAEAKYEDFEEVVMRHGDNETNKRLALVSTASGRLLLESDQSESDIAYDARQRSKSWQRKFSAKLPLQQAAWLGRKEAEISAGTGATASDDKAGKSEDTRRQSRNERKVSKAPAPVHTGSAGKVPTGSVPGDTHRFRGL
jgi:hypothetical protein